MKRIDQLKMASFLMPQPKLSDKARVAGRTAFEGGVGAYGGGAAASLLLGALAKTRPSGTLAGMFGPLVGAAAGAGGVAGGVHGYHAAMRNAQQRLNPWEALKRKLGFA